MIIYGDAARVAPEPGATDVARAAQNLASPLISANIDRELTLADGRVLQIAAMIDPSDIRVPETLIASVSTVPTGSGGVTISASASHPDDDPRPMVAVTGRSVNLRAGPSTDTRVLRALTRGTQAELIAALDNGWVQIRVASTGTVGYMAGQFVSSVN